MANTTDSSSDSFPLFGGSGYRSISLDKLQDRIGSIAEETRINETYWDFFSIYIWVVCMIGLPANVVIVITIVAMRVTSPATVFVTLLAICDGMALLGKLIGHQLVFYKVEKGTLLCKLDMIPNYFSTQANWVLVLICAERFVSVCYPLKKNYLLTKRRCYLTAGGLFAVLFVFFAVLFFLMRDSAPYDHQCTTTAKYFHFWATYWPWISVLLYLFVPFILITAFTVPIIRGLAMSRKQRRSLVLKKNESGMHTEADLRLLRDTERTEKMITVMLIVAAVVFLVLCLPACIYYLMLTLSPPSRGVATANFTLFKQVAYLFADMSHTVNFFLYFFTAKRFRSFAYKTFCPCCYKRNIIPSVCGSGRKEENNSASSRATVSTRLNSPVDSPV